LVSILLKYKREKLCHEILAKYLGAPSLIHRPEFLTQEYPNGELDIFYPEQLRELGLIE